MSLLTGDLLLWSGYVHQLFLPTSISNIQFPFPRLARRKAAKKDSEGIQTSSAGPSIIGRWNPYPTGPDTVTRTPPYDP